MPELKWTCRSCGHKHSEADWMATPEPRYCHACGSQAVRRTDDLKWRQENSAPPPEPAPREYFPIIERPAPQPKPEPEPEPEPEAVQVPDEIQVDELGTMKKPHAAPHKKTPKAAVPKAAAPTKPKPKRRGR